MLKKIITLFQLGRKVARSDILSIISKFQEPPLAVRLLFKVLSFSFFTKKETNIKYLLRAVPNEIRGGIATSLIFSAWNAAVYVNQISDEQVLKAERKKNYLNIVKDIVNKNKGLYFNNEIFVIERK